MKTPHAAAAAILAVALAHPALAASGGGSGGSPSSTQLSCDIGPVTKNYGGRDWLAYSCQDGASLKFTLVTQNNRAHCEITKGPGYKNGQIFGTVMGGNCEAAANDPSLFEAVNAAHMQIGRMTPAETEALIAETRTTPPPRPPSE